MKKCLITGSSGLVGSQSVHFFCTKGYKVIGIDNDMRKYFFDVSTSHVESELSSKYKEQYSHHSIDIRDKNKLEEIFVNNDIDCIIHCAAQPSHDWAAKEPHTDFEINALATLHLLELTRKHAPNASFVFMSTNKVYGDTPNNLNVVELKTRYEVLDESVNETMSIDQCKHSLFGASKLSADILVQEYGRYFGMNTVVFRGGCITGGDHQGAENHGFLAYLVKCMLQNKPYTIFGYKGKQVRDNIHAYDLVNAFWSYIQNPRPGVVYNIGGGRDNSLSVIEAIDKINKITGKTWNKWTCVPENRSGDHIWYITDLKKFSNDYPEWKLKYSIDDILKDIIRVQGGDGVQYSHAHCCIS
jgi:CDP-paratose 2-epimerase